jgi:hypothetical protein
MRWKISHKLDSKLGAWSHDSRTIDLLAILALLVLVLGSGWYVSSSLTTPPSTTAFIVPSQSVHW